MNILVTGGSGFVGSYVVRELLSSGHTPVIYDQMTSGNVLDDVLGADQARSVKSVAGSVTDLAALANACKSNQVSRVIHLAGCLIPQCTSDPYQASLINVMGTANVFETGRLLGLERVVYASTIAVYQGSQEQDAPLLAEEDLIGPESLYGASKATNESQGAIYAAEFGLDNVGIRFPVGYGAGRRRGRGAWMQELLYKPAVGEPGEVLWADDIVPWLYMEDLASAVTAATLAESVPSRVYNTRGVTRVKRDVARIVRQLLPDSSIKLIPGKSGLPYNVDQSRIERELGWAPRVGLEEGVLRTINAVRAMHDLAPVG